MKTATSLAFHALATGLVVSVFSFCWVAGASRIARDRFREFVG